MSLMEHRVGENGVLPFRTGRVFNIGSEWFFAVRGGKDCGPFKNFKEAENGLNLYLTNIEPSKTH